MQIRRHDTAWQRKRSLPEGSFRINVLSVCCGALPSGVSLCSAVNFARAAQQVMRILDILARGACTNSRPGGHVIQRFDARVEDDVCSFGIAESVVSHVAFAARSRRGRHPSMKADGRRCFAIAALRFDDRHDSGRNGLRRDVCAAAACQHGSRNRKQLFFSAGFQSSSRCTHSMPTLRNRFSPSSER